MTDRTHYVGCWREHHECAVNAVVELRDAILDYIDWWNLEHHDGCPQDDTCTCNLVRAIETALNHTREATPPAAPDDGTSQPSQPKPASEKNSHAP